MECSKNGEMDIKDKPENTESPQQKMNDGL